MQNKKALELAISTLVLIILGIAILVAIILAISGGFDNLKTATDPLLDTTKSSAIKQACSLACDNADKLTYCCKEYKLENTKIKCYDERLGNSCPSDYCNKFPCDAPATT
jgi:hypothetical protein